MFNKITLIFILAFGVSTFAHQGPLTSNGSHRGEDGKIHKHEEVYCNYTIDVNNERRNVYNTFGFSHVSTNIKDFIDDKQNNTINELNDFIAIQEDLGNRVEVVRRPKCAI